MKIVLRLIVVLFLGLSAKFLTKPLNAFPDINAYFTQLSSNAGLVTIWLFGLYGLSDFLIRQIRK